MYKLYSERIKNKDGEPEIYIYDKIPEAFKNQTFYIMSDVFDKYSDFQQSIWDMIHDRFAREKGLKKLGQYEANGVGYGKPNIELYILNTNVEDTLDLLDFSFHIMDVSLRELQPNQPYFGGTNALISHAIEELNYRFKQHNLGYEFVNGSIIRIDHKLLHQEVIKPALRLLYEEGFEGAEEEFRNAFEKRKKGIIEMLSLKQAEHLKAP